MIKTKNDLTKVAKDWLEKFLIKKYSSKYNVEVIICEQYISKINHPKIKEHPGYSAFNFQPDVLGILTDKKTQKVELVFLNRSYNAISLREIGELFCYSKLANPLLSILFSYRGAANEINLILLNDKTAKNLLNFSDNKFIQLVQINQDGKKLLPTFYFPIDSNIQEEFLSVSI